MPRARQRVLRAVWPLHAAASQQVPRLSAGLLAAAAARSGRGAGRRLWRSAVATLPSRPAATESSAWGRGGWRTVSGTILAYLVVLLAWRMYIRNLPLEGLHTLMYTHFIHLVVFGVLSLGKWRENAKGLANSIVAVLALVSFEVLTHVILEWNVSTPGAGVLVGLLSGIAILYVMAFSSAILQKTYHRLTWIGASLVALGIACSVPAARGALGQNWLLPILSMAALLLPSLNLVVKEMLLRDRPVSREGASLVKLDIFAVAAVSAFGQLLGTVVHGFIINEAQILPRAPPSVFTLQYSAASWLVRMAIVVALQRTSAFAVQTANALAVPVGGALFLAPHMSPRLIFGLVAALAGSTCAVVSQAPTVSPKEEVSEAPVVVQEEPNTTEPQVVEPEENVEFRRSLISTLQSLEAERQSEKRAEERARSALWVTQAVEEVEAVRKIKAVKRKQAAVGAGRAVSGAALAVGGAVAAGATVVAGVAIGAGAIVTAGLVVVAGGLGPIEVPKFPPQDASSSAKGKER